MKFPLFRDKGCVGAECVALGWRQATIYHDERCLFPEQPK
jgi:hypothetical protein